MSAKILVRRGTNAQRLLLSGGSVPSLGELLWCTDTGKFYVGDGSTTGGVEIAISADRVTDLPASNKISETITQNTHGFVTGNVLRHNGTAYVKAQANNDTNAEALGVVGEIIDANNFELVYEGIVDVTGYTTGVYYLSDSTAGLLTLTAPTSVGTINKPIAIAISATKLQVVNYRGITITSAIGSATTTSEGVIELATQTEFNTGTDNTRAVTSALVANGILDGGSF